MVNQISTIKPIIGPEQFLHQPVVNPQDEPTDPSKPINAFPNDRLSADPALRVLFLGSLAFITGTISGMVRGYQATAVRFRAENAHRLPRSEKNWFYYGRAKSLVSMSSAMALGPKMGARLVVPAVTFSVLESGVDHARGGASKDFLSTVVASIATAGLYSLVTRQAVPEASKLFRLSFKGGLVCGLGQDVISYLSGRPLFYVNYIKRQFGYESDDTTEAVE